MSEHETTNHWARATVWLHWAAALLLVALAAVGKYMVDLPPSSPMRLWLTRLHVVFGVALVLLTLVRLWFRGVRRAPAALPIPKLHAMGLSLVHFMLYTITFAVGTSGVATVLNGGLQSYLKGSAHEMPALDLVTARSVHENLAFSLLSLVALHIGSVVLVELQYGKTMERMLPRGRQQPPPSSPTSSWGQHA